MFGHSMFMRRRTFAPGPYGTPIQVPVQFRTLPWILGARTHAFPKQDRVSFDNALANPAPNSGNGISHGTYFLSSCWHPYSDPMTGMRALSEGQKQFRDIQERAAYKHAAGMPLNETEARTILPINTPLTPNWPAIHRAEAHGAGQQTFDARQIAYYPKGNGMPAAVYRVAQALQDPFAQADPRQIVSRSRNAADVMGRQVQQVMRVRPTKMSHR